MIKFNVASINQYTESEGIGKRLAIWFQGCDRRCKGCCNQSLQEIVKRHIISLDELVDIVKNAKNEFSIEGITLLGGEPTLQQGLELLCSQVQQLNLTVILFTGKLFVELDSKLTSQIDIIIDGHFNISQLDNTRNMVGSTNQKIICTSDKYKDKLDWFTTKRPKQVEFNFRADTLFSNGDVIDLKEKD